MGINVTRLKTRSSLWLSTSALAITLSTSVLAAPVPVVDSQPLANPASSQPTEGQTTGSLPSGESSGTAYLLNTMEQMRQEIMELRGQLEEQQFQIKQLRQEGRDRYLDLDERITRQSNGASVPSPTLSTSTMTDLKDNSRSASNQAAPSKADEKQAAEQQAYQSAFQLIREKKFDEARQALKRQLDTYPKGKYADNARYWLGEVQMAQSQYPQARDSFQMVLSDFPDSPKVPDASYKLGRVLYLLGENEKARAMLESVIKQYPDTAAARLSDTYLRNQ